MATATQHLPGGGGQVQQVEEEFFRQPEAASAASSSSSSSSGGGGGGGRRPATATGQRHTSNWSLQKTTLGDNSAVHADIVDAAALSSQDFLTARNC